MITLIALGVFFALAASAVIFLATAVLLSRQQTAGADGLIAGCVVIAIAVGHGVRELYAWRRVQQKLF